MNFVYDQFGLTPPADAATPSSAIPLTKRDNYRRSSGCSDFCDTSPPVIDYYGPSGPVPRVGCFLFETPLGASSSRGGSTSTVPQVGLSSSAPLIVPPPIP